MLPPVELVKTGVSADVDCLLYFIVREQNYSKSIEHTKQDLSALFDAPEPREPEQEFY